ncbi:hypothetical protein BR93DRAFT_550059 [Coniochaeta sp. PMI_546]|nr:hypothetical protein BR93DRAFT_550059 [Coniochaeta sp. PMI_546]
MLRFDVAVSVILYTLAPSDQYTFVSQTTSQHPKRPWPLLSVTLTWPVVQVKHRVSPVMRTFPLLTVIVHLVSRSMSGLPVSPLTSVFTSSSMSKRLAISEMNPINLPARPCATWSPSGFPKPVAIRQSVNSAKKLPSMSRVLTGGSSQKLCS